MFTLFEHQKKAIEQLATGKVLVGGTGSGKSITSLVYGKTRHPGKIIFVITTAKKRNSGEWWSDGLTCSLTNRLVVDSWNNIEKYTDVEGELFIFDEQRLSGSGAWVSHFQKIASKNDWVLLSATPADTWMDLVPVFVANGFFPNRSAFIEDHVRFSRYTKYPKVDRYFHEDVLDRMRKSIYVEMPHISPAERVYHTIEVDYDAVAEETIQIRRWNTEENRPIRDAGEMVRLLRSSSNLHPSRYSALLELVREKRRVIVFYNHNPELEILRHIGEDLGIPVAEWNGHLHEDIPDGDDWVYLVQYQAGAEGWNCITTDTVAFYSLPYSYKQLEQGRGRIDRINTPYKTLHYYTFRNQSLIDRMIWRGLNRKKNFQVSAFAKQVWTPPAQELPLL